MAARLRFQEQGKGGIAANVDPLDRIHLDGDVQGHQSDPVSVVGSILCGGVYRVIGQSGQREVAPLAGLLI
jgi:hypothetical protein